MRTLIVLLSAVLVHAACAQHLTYSEWQVLAAKDLRLVPRYEGRPKNAEMLRSDSSFIAQMLAVIPDHRKASDHLVDLGFEQLRKGDLTSAMFRFNQAYLMEPDNASIYRGYGAFFVALDRNTEAAKQYRDGLAIDSTDSRLLTDMAAVFLAEHYTLKESDPDKAEQFVDVAITLLDRAMQYDPKSAEAAFKLSVCHLLKNECAEAWRYHDQCKALGGTPSLTDDYVAELVRKCPR